MTKSRFKSLVDSALGWMRKEAQSGLLSFRLATEPYPASRPRVAKFGVYYGKNYSKFRKLAAPLAKTFDGHPIEGPFVILLDHVCTKPKTGKRAYPVGDVDNYAKGPLDVMKDAQKFFSDDDQVVGLLSFKRYAEPGEEPGVYAYWFPV